MATFHKYKKKGSNKDFWEYRIYYHDPITKKIRERAKKGFKSKPEAKLAAAEMERKLLEGYEQTDISLKSYLENWLQEYKKGTVRKNTFQLHQQNIKNHILPYFKNIVLKDLKPLMYQKFINHLAEQGYSRRTVEIVHGTMYNACEKAVITGKLEKNPCAGVTIKGEKKKMETEFIESAHISDFLSAAYNYNYIYGVFFRTLIETGMRKGEAAALQWSDIDFKKKTISITKSFDFQEAPKNSDEMFGDTKTYNSTRIITFGKFLEDTLKFHIKYQNQNKLALGDTYRHDLNLVFARNDGDYLPKSTLHNAFKRILKAADLPQNLKIHSLRHTHAVLQLEAGADMKYIQERLGHGSMQITADVYSHVSKKIEERQTSNFDNYMDDLLK
ncbi:site-specific integrase [Heyndrickxia acidiproducens]|uniref:site-specific integrase n=1 Tax=Heyndrickxia acidiproducens TaxID=1121084 RepID=UPI000362C3C6|nr:site-specific integrase [Heyndrickxia acidiproducens]